MAGDNTHDQRRPAQTSGGQRRRLVRRSSIPRSNTTPLLNTASIATSEDSEGLGFDANAGEGATAEQVESGESSLETSQSMMDFYPPTGIPIDLRPTTSGRLSVPGSASPTPSAGSEPSTKADGRKKHGRKIKDFVLGSNKQLVPPPYPTPLPPSTPTKAAKLLGVGSNGRIPGSPLSSQHDGSADGASDGRTWVQQGLGWPQQHSASDLMRSASSNTVISDYRDSRFREEDIDVDLTKPKDSKSFWNSGKKVTKKLSGFLSPTRNVSQTPSSDNDLQHLSIQASPPHSMHLETNFVHSVDHDLDDSHYLEHPQMLASSPFAPPPVPDRPVPAANSRRPAKRRGRNARGMDEMAPITEASHDDMSSAYHVGENNPELGVLSAYAHDIPPRSASLQPHAHHGYHPTSQPGSYELKENELSSGEEHANTALVEETEKDKQFGGDDAKWQHSESVYLRSPLQNVEDRLLDAAEKKLKRTHVKEDSSPEEEDYLLHGSTASLSKAKQRTAASASVALPDEDYTKAATQEDFDRRFAAISEVVAGLKANHEKMREDFAAIKKKQEEEEDDEASEDDADLPSLRSSIDLSEEPTVHVATAMTITRITPGMVKLVDIPPRKK